MFQVCVLAVSVFMCFMFEVCVPDVPMFMCIFMFQVCVPAVPVSHKSSPLCRLGISASINKRCPPILYHVQWAPMDHHGSQPLLVHGEFASTMVHTFCISPVQQIELRRI